MDNTRGLWRGKVNGKMYPKHIGNWVLGSLTCEVLQNNQYDYYFTLRDLGGIYPVDPETLGECTGLSDKNGKLIFEGDIIDYENPDGIYTYMVA